MWRRKAWRRVIVTSIGSLDTILFQMGENEPWAQNCSFEFTVTNQQLVTEVSVTIDEYLSSRVATR
jgi:hypothetical protein